MAMEEEGNSVCFVLARFLYVIVFSKPPCLIAKIKLEKSVQLEQQ